MILSVIKKRSKEPHFINTCVILVLELSNIHVTICLHFSGTHTRMYENLDIKSWRGAIVFVTLCRKEGERV